MKQRHNYNGNVEEIKAGIRETRSQMDTTLDELTERLRPRHLLDDLLDYFQSRRERGAHDGERVKRAASQMTEHVKDAAADTGRTVARQIRRHPMPSLLIGAGLAWLLMESAEEEGYAELYSEEAARQYYDEIGEYSGPSRGAIEVEGLAPRPEGYALPAHYAGPEGEGIKEKIREKGSEWKDRASAGMERVRRRTARRTDRWRDKAAEKGSEWKEQARDSYEEGVEAFQRTADAHPLAVGAGFLAIGVLAGILLPSSRKEDEWMGPSRDRIVHRTRDAAEEAVERGKQVAKTAVEAATSEAREQGLTPSALKEQGAHVVDSARRTAEEEGLTPSGVKDKAKIVTAETKEAAQSEAEKQKSEFQGA